MSDVQELTLDELLDQADVESVAGLSALADRVNERGGGIAVYANVDLGHPGLGHKQFITFGHPDAGLIDDAPPERLPDFRNAINWRYHLEGTWTS